MLRLLLVLCAILPLTSNSTFASTTKPPRQKIEIKGLTKTGKNELLTIERIEKEVNLITASINDPYNNNVKTTFSGVYFSDLVNKYAKPETTKVFVKAIDGYSVETPIEIMKSEKMIFAIKDQDGYLSVTRMGPARIIYPIKETVSKEQLLKIGLHWVWQIKSLEFKK